jgi:outer membrane lipoprotein-sorting protein
MKHRNKIVHSLVLLAAWPLFCSLTAAQPDTNAFFLDWLAAQTNIQTWSADVTQVRSLKALTQPLTSTGHVWFQAPNRFHWELGNPAQTIAVRQTDQLLVIYPRLKRAERYPLTGTEAGQFKDTLALLDAGFPRSRAEVESRFNILSQRVADGMDELALQPKSETARQFMPQITIGFDTHTFALRSTEMKFQDGSTMQTLFTNAQLNPHIDEKLFNPDLAGYKIVEPFKR